MRLSIGKSRKDTNWKVVDVTWEKLCEKLSTPVRTSETMAEYKAMNKTDKATKKDVGGFIGGATINGSRTKGSITTRSFITLDADYANTNLVDNLSICFEWAMCIYSTHSSTPKAPRLRLIIPLNREVTEEEYEPIARMVAKDIGIEQFDVTTYQTNRLMYWPSVPSDAEYIYEVIEGDFLDADATLGRYDDWHDTTEYPVASSEATVRAKEAKAQGDPTGKPGLVGLFCRAYDVYSAIEEFLPEVYTSSTSKDRYTYTGGSTFGGMVVYQNGAFAYSHHSTDPACGVLCNAFDLVRLHKFAELDMLSDPDTPTNKLPSYKAMCDFARECTAVKQELLQENIDGAKRAFAEAVEPDTDWASQLQLNKNGAVESTTENIVTILENDPNISGRCAINQFTNRLCVVQDLPWKKCEDKVNGTSWSDMDDSALRHYIETTYGISNNGKVTDALNVSMLKHAFHPVRTYLEGLEWDGIKRGEHLFIHYLGAEDNLYTRTVTKKWLTAAVNRIMVPGCKFDNMVVLVGAQGIGKSYLGKTLGKGWYSDTFNTLQGKEAFEQLKGAWILEMGELSVMKKAEVESVKLFISKQEDNYRAAYGRHSQSNKRQCVFYGTTNDDSFLRDRTGNRRFWPIGCDSDKALYDVFSLTPEDVDQIWAEAMHWYNSGETLYLSREVAKLAVEEQDKYMTLDPRTGVIEDYLDVLIPDNWDTLSKSDRRNFIQGYLTISDETPLLRRDSINVVELAYELYGIEELQPYQAKEFHLILTGIKGWKKGPRVRTIYGQQYVYERQEK